VKTIPIRFEEVGSGNYSLDMFLPAPPRVGEHVEIDGFNWLVTEVTWVIETDPKAMTTNFSVIAMIK